jgi:hypothetical protein
MLFSPILGAVTMLLTPQTRPDEPNGSWPRVECNVAGARVGPRPDAYRQRLLFRLPPRPGRYVVTVGVTMDDGRRWERQDTVFVTRNDLRTGVEMRFGSANGLQHIVSTRRNPDRATYTDSYQLTDAAGEVRVTGTCAIVRVF